MNVQPNNQSFYFKNQNAFLNNRINQISEANNIGEVQAVPPVNVITRLHLKEMENMKTSFRNQVRNVVALDQFIRQRLVQVGSDLGEAGPALIGINFGEELSFRLPGSDEAFNIFTATLKRKSYFLHHRSRAVQETKVLKVDLKVTDMASLEQELSIILENIVPTDYVATVLQMKRRNAQKPKMVG